MSTIDLAALNATALVKDPFDFVIVERFIRPEVFKAVVADFPAMVGEGSHPPAELSIAGAFKALMDDLEGPEFRTAVERKFDLDLTGVRPCIRCGATSATATATSTPIPRPRSSPFSFTSTRGGKRMADGLRLLRSSSSLDNPVAEVSPNGGTLLIFKRSDNSWHGHKPFKGQRRAIQLNYVTDADVVASEQRRHAFAARVKKVKTMLLPMAG